VFPTTANCNGDTFFLGPDPAQDIMAAAINAKLTARKLVFMTEWFMSPGKVLSFLIYPQNNEN